MCRQGYIRMSSTIEWKPITLERILAQGNLAEAYRRVVRNKGAAGVDGMEAGELGAWCQAHPRQISASVLNGTYRPKPIRRQYIPKDNGEKRPLGIPTVTDRFVQQAVAQVLSEEYEKIFSDNSFGFRPGRSCRMAIDRALSYLEEGFEWVIDLDLSKFFDTVNHSKLLQILSDRIEDGRVVSLIHRFLRAPVCEDGRTGPKTTQGTPQGGCVSPVLANILLNELDQRLDAQGRKFVRYADDMVIMCRSRKACERVLESVTKFIETKLFLKVNKAKTKIVHAGDGSQFLGFTFTTRVGSKRRKEHPRRRWFANAHPRKLAKLRAVLAETLDRRGRGGFRKVQKDLKQKLAGWCAYFHGCIPPTAMEGIDMWIRRRIRQMHWKLWKKPGKRLAEIRKRWPKAPGIGEYAYSVNSYWRMARTPVINKALSNANLISEGWTWLEDTESRLG